MSLLILSVLPLSGIAQTKGFDPDKLYRPVYGYVIDTCSNLPVSGVLVYGFDSVDDAKIGKEALYKSLNPLKIKINGEVVETRTDASGRYMLPALSRGAIVFWFKDRKLAAVEEIAGRNEVSLGKKEKGWTLSDLDLDKYAVNDEIPSKSRRPEPVGVELNMDFNCYIPYLGDQAGDCQECIECQQCQIDEECSLPCNVILQNEEQNCQHNRDNAVNGAVTNDRVAKQPIPDVHTAFSENVDRADDHGKGDHYEHIGDPEGGGVIFKSGNHKQCYIEEQNRNQ